MADPPALTLEQRIAAAQAWWREAGVDYAYGDEPAGWLADDTPPDDPPAPLRSEPSVAPPRQVGGDPAQWPHDLATFRQWWLEEPSLDAGGTAPRIVPRGEAGAPLLVLVPMPEADDRDTLLSGPQGRLLASFALACGLAPEQAYFAAALPRHTPLPDWERLRAEGHGEVLLHHLHLADPKRLIILGRSILPLLGHDPAQAAPAFTEISIQTRKLPLLASFAPERLLANARQRAGLWQRWLEWTDGETG